MDGTPFVLTVPYLFVEAFQNPEDYYARPYYTSGDLKDSMVRLPLWSMIFRPSLLGGTRRQGKKGMMQRLAKLKGNKN